MPERYEREIEELLRQIGDLSPREASSARLRRAWGNLAHQSQQATQSLGRYLTPGNLVKAALALLLGSLLLRAMMPSFSVYAYLIGLVLLVVGIAGFVLTDRPAPEQRWRGRIIELPNNRPPWWLELWQRWVNFWKKPNQ
jgi:hypothetical protein